MLRYALGIAEMVSYSLLPLSQCNIDDININII